MDSLEGIDSRFRHAILAAKRAKQLVGGARKKVDMVAENPLTIAIEEIRQGKINFHILEEEEAKKFPTEEVEVEENKEDNEIDRDLFFRTDVTSGFDEDEEDEDEDEVVDADDDENEDEEDEDIDDDDGDDDRDDYDDDYDDDDGMIYEGDEEDD